MDFDHWRPKPRRHLDLIGSGGDEERHANARPHQLGDHGRKHIVLAHDIEPAFGRELRPSLGHKANRMWLRLERNRNHLLGGRHLEIERLADLGLEARHVVIADMAAILTQMRRDAVGTGLDRK